MITHRNPLLSELTFPSNAAPDELAASHSSISLRRRLSDSSAVGICWQIYELCKTGSSWKPSLSNYTRKTPRIFFPGWLAGWLRQVSYFATRFDVFLEIHWNIYANFSLVTQWTEDSECNANGQGGKYIDNVPKVARYLATGSSRGRILGVFAM